MLDQLTRDHQDTLADMLEAEAQLGRWISDLRRDHAEWSEKTFGDVGPVGPLKHLAKEALEAAADPADLSEWADLWFLLWDAQRRAGVSDAAVLAAGIDKLEVIKARTWPEPVDGEPCEHVRWTPSRITPPVDDAPTGAAAVWVVAGVVGTLVAGTRALGLW